jgi:UrcA family protein
MKTDTYNPGRFARHTAFRSSIVALVGIAVMSWSSVQAAPPAPPPVLTQTSLVVRLGDLDLSSAQGVRAAYERVRVAVQQACAFTTHMGDYVVGSREVYSHCYRDTMAKTIKQLDRTQLAALHQQMSSIAGY